MTINESEISHNRGREGGGVFAGECDLAINRSAIHNNTATGNGGGISVDSDSSLTMTNSTLYANTAIGGGGGLFTMGGSHKNLDLRHVTITGNSGGSIGGGILLVYRYGTIKFRNSIIYGNTDSTGDNDCTSSDEYITMSSENNIIGASANCVSGETDSSDDPMLPAVPVAASPPVFPLPGNSPAVNAANCLDGVKVDQRGVPRPFPAGSMNDCDIGAYEWMKPPAPPADRSGGGSRAGTAAREILTRDPAPLNLPTCVTLPIHIIVSNVTPSTQCQQVGRDGIGNAEVLDAGFIDGVDIWGWVLPNTEVCFLVSSGSFRFLDAATMPRAVSSLPAFSKMPGMVCAKIDRAGTVALIAGPPAPAPTAAPRPTNRLSGCMVKTNYLLNMRDAPAGAKIGEVAYDVTLTALERTPGWFKVDYHGERGWIAAMYVEPKGNCG